MPLFSDENGASIKFHLQHDLEPDVRETLTDDIVTHGGTILDKVPLQGFVLVDPNSERGEKLLARWRTPDKPNRRVLPTTFVVACIAAKCIIPAIFVSKGEPLRMHIHESVQDQTSRDRACERIWHYGGHPTELASDAQVIIVNNDANIRRVQADYAVAQATIHVEPLKWIKRCVEQGDCIFSRTKAPVFVRRPTNKRTEFTAEDDNNLAVYLAKHHPDASQVGRKGKTLYEHLCANPKTYPWAKRHPWQSWRERYVKRQDYFDPKIDVYVGGDGLSEDENTTASQESLQAEQAEQSSDSETEAEADVDKPDVPESEDAQKSAPASPIRERSCDSKEKKPSQSPTSSRSMESVSSSGSEWAIRIAVDEESRPDWAKRGQKRPPPSQTVTPSSPLKRARSGMQEAMTKTETKQITTDSKTASGSDTSKLARKTSASSIVDDLDARVSCADVAIPDAENAQSQAFAQEVFSDGIGPETQQLLDEHNSARQHQANGFNPSLLVARLSHTPEQQDLQDRIHAIANETHFWFQEIHDFYDQSQDLSLTETVFRRMRDAADQVKRAAVLKHLDKRTKR